MVEQTKIVKLGSIVAITLILLIGGFQLFANASAQTIDEGVETNMASTILEVSIPCPGQAPLISERLVMTQGIETVEFSYPNLFEVIYDTTKVSENEIINLELFGAYTPTIISLDEATAISAAAPTTATCPNSGSTSSCDGTCDGSCDGNCSH